MSQPTAPADTAAPRRLVDAALRLAGAVVEEGPEAILIADIPSDHRRSFGNRSRIRYTDDRKTRTYHPDVEYVTAGAALLTQSIRFIREQTSVVRSRPQTDYDSDGDGALVRMLDTDLRLTEATAVAQEPHLVAKALVSVTMEADDRSSFLREVVVPLNIDDAQARRASHIVARAVPVSEPADGLGLSYEQVLQDVLDRAASVVARDITSKEQELESLLQDAADRLGQTAALEARKRDLALRVELDVAYLEVIELPRVKHGGIISDPDGQISLKVGIAAYEGTEIVASCPSCSGRTSRIDLCEAGDVHVCCPACALRCAGCGSRACRTHPVRVCSAAACSNSFCTSCLVRCTDCGDEFCIDHRASCSICSGVACVGCQTVCAFHEGTAHRSHIGACKDCGRPVCDNEAVFCRFGGGASERICPDDAVTCQVSDHLERGCAEHIQPCTTCDRLGCPDHQMACADCGRSGCIDDSVVCAIGDEWTLRTHAAECQQCSTLVCGAHSKRCAVCAGVVCDLHADVCTFDCHAVCSADSIVCPECGDRTCAAHSAVCVVGGHRVCNRAKCRTACATDGAAVCLTHSVLCERGGEPVCMTHVARCDIAGEHLCGDHALGCEFCGQIHCSEHGSTCAVCGRVPLCEECATVDLSTGDRACDSCLGSEYEPGLDATYRRPWHERMVDRSPLVARSKSQVVVLSTGAILPTARTFMAAGELIDVHRIPRDRARAIAQAAHARRGAP